MTSLRSSGYVDPGWEHGTAQDVKKKKVRCNYCGKVVSGGIYRLKQHLARVSGEVTYCEKAPEEVCLKMKEIMEGCRIGKKPKQIEYEEQAYLNFPSNDDVEEARIPTLLAITILLTYLNYRGLHIVGFSAVLLASFSLLPFLVMGVLSIPKIRPQRWVTLDFKKVQWRGYFNSMFWNLNYWDKASTLAGEVENPSRTFPKALYGAVIVVVCSYLIPLLAGTGSLDSDSNEWSDGYFAEVGFLIGGSWLKWWIQAASAMSNLGLFEAEMSSDAFQLLGMSEIGMLPSVFASRSKYGTPTLSILCSATGVIFLSWMSFQEILEFLNFLYAIGMLFEFAAFIKLRLKKPDLHRPYKVPLKTFGATMLCVPPATLLVLVMCLASGRTFLVTGLVIVLGFFLYPLIIHAKNKKWAHFVSIDDVKSNDRDVEDDENVMRHVDDEAGVHLLSDSSSSNMEKVSEILPEGDEIP